ncbi:Sensor histidine kinase RcsC [Pleomorphomonas sp. T1.2MG-36]|uniref:response regulator n=1 Tax=Pleomorphomonas sp. T1.2MG-36 TaxID=3041167 RepID=UPI002477AB35|nr:response regulator [Pleomorphomonas sp. T1.2MG-36]CAI9407119.1 Sensor histidine kinase RcsC [Pleomorphomonas sp. T1.2MG-36]
MPKLTDYIARTIVIVDDSPRFRRFVAGMLNEFGFHDIHEFSDTDAAFEFLTGRHVDLVMSDLGMEPMDGFAFADRIRHGGAIVNRMVPVLLMTGHASRQNVQKAVMAGIDEIAVKPMSSSYLAERLLTVFGRPRVYVKTGSGYFGPDRRRRNDPTYRGPERRSGQPAEIVSEERLLVMREAASLRSRGLLSETPVEFPLPENPGFLITHINFRPRTNEAVYGDLVGARANPIVPVVVKRSKRPRGPSQPSRNG